MRLGGENKTQLFNVVDQILLYRTDRANLDKYGLLLPMASNFIIFLLLLIIYTYKLLKSFPPQRIRSVGYI